MDSAGGGVLGRQQAALGLEGAGVAGGSRVLPSGG